MTGGIREGKEKFEDSHGNIQECGQLCVELNLLILISVYDYFSNVVSICYYFCAVLPLRLGLLISRSAPPPAGKFWLSNYSISCASSRMHTFPSPSTNFVLPKIPNPYLSTRRSNVQTKQPIHPHKNRAKTEPANPRASPVPAI